MKFSLFPLPFGTSDLNPVLSEQTIAFHHGKHHQTYVTNLNHLIQGTRFETFDLETIVKESDGAIFNNAAQVWNHTFYFEQFTKTLSKSSPSGFLLKKIEMKWGSFEKFKEEFNAASVGLFGSGWCWLVQDAQGELKIEKESNAGNPMTRGLSPIMTFDVWEHAYYLDYQNRRADYVNALWSILDWAMIEKRMK